MLMESLVCWPDCFAGDSPHYLLILKQSLTKPLTLGSSVHLQIRNSRIYYEASGTGEPLLLLHGGFGTVEDFASQTPELAKHFRVVSFERPGHGHTADTAGAFSLDTMAAGTGDFIEGLKTESDEPSGLERRRNHRSSSRHLPARHGQTLCLCKRALRHQGSVSRRSELDQIAHTRVLPESWIASGKTLRRNLP